jgi:hypothetical protein
MTDIIKIDYKISGETTVDWPAYYNSFFSTEGVNATQNARLTIVLRAKLVPIGPKTQIHASSPERGFLKWPKVLNVWDKTWVDCGEWPDVFWLNFQSVVPDAAARFWSNTEPAWGNPGFCLMPVGDWKGLDWPLGARPTHRLNVDCDFVWHPADNEDDAHIIFYCAFLPWPKGTPPTVQRVAAWVKPGRTNATGCGFLTWDQVSLPAHCSCGVLPPILIGAPIPHEIGHAIGLLHIGVTKRLKSCLEAKGLTKDGLDPCALGDTPEDKNNIMGYGNKVTFENALPWLVRATQHTHTKQSDWMICMGKRAPRQL